MNIFAKQKRNYSELLYVVLVLSFSRHSMFLKTQRYNWQTLIISPKHNCSLLWFYIITMHLSTYQSQWPSTQTYTPDFKLYARKSWCQNTAVPMERACLCVYLQRRGIFCEQQQKVQNFLLRNVGRSGFWASSYLEHHNQDTHVPLMAKIGWLNEVSECFVMLVLCQL